MRQPTPGIAQTHEREESRRRGVATWLPVLLVVGAAAVVWGFVLVTFLGGDEEPDPDTTPVTEDAIADLLRPEGPTFAEGLVVGDVAPLSDGALARVNSIEPGASVDPRLPQPEPGTRLFRLDVELCAGDGRLFVDAAFWQGVGADDRVHSSHLGVRDLLTFTMAPGTCQRGDVDLQLPDGVELAEVILMDSSHSTVGRWAVAPNPPPPDRLDPTSDPETTQLGSAAEPETGGSVHLHGIEHGPVDDSATTVDPGQTLVRIDAERCADNAAPQHIGPRLWFVQLDDHQLIAAEREGSTMGTGELDPSTCDRGTADFIIPADSQPVAVIYTYGSIYEEARWTVDP